jgi:hypothetical protein
VQGDRTKVVVMVAVADVVVLAVAVVEAVVARVVARVEGELPKPDLALTPKPVSMTGQIPWCSIAMSFLSSLR